MTKSKYRARHLADKALPDSKIVAHMVRFLLLIASFNLQDTLAASVIPIGCLTSIRQVCPDLWHLPALRV